MPKSKTDSMKPIPIIDEELLADLAAKAEEGLKSKSLPVAIRHECNRIALASANIIKYVKAHKAPSPSN